MKFDILTIFPHIFDSYFNESILGKARKKGLVDVFVHDLKKFSQDKKHFKIDDRPFGGGPGMVLKIDPIYRAVESILHSKQIPKTKRSTRKRIFKKPKKTRIILFSAKGKQFRQKDARRYARYYNNLIFICGRYEGVDERVAQHIADEEISIGPYILTGGEIPAMVVVDAVSRFVPGVLGKKESLEEKRTLANNDPTVPPLTKGRLGGVSHIASYPVYTRPEVFEPKPGTKWRVPKVLLSGDHKKIEEWRRRHIKKQETINK